MAEAAGIHLAESKPASSLNPELLLNPAKMPVFYVCFA
jgi:hypothetical protein